MGAGKRLGDGDDVQRMASMNELLQNFDFGIAALVFAAYLVIDAFYAQYTYAVVKKNPLQAANIGFVMHFLLAFGVVNYVGNFFYVIPLALGSWLGTYLVVQREKSKDIA